MDKIFLKEKFIDHLEFDCNYSNNTIIAYSKIIDKFILYLDEFDLDINRFASFNSFLDDVSNSNLSSRSINQIITVLRQFCLFCNNSYGLFNGFESKLKLIKTGVKLPKYLNKDELDLLINQPYISNVRFILRDKTIILVLYSTGVRVSELINLKISNINFSNNFIDVIGKGNKERIIPVSSETIAYIKNYLDEYQLNDINDYLFLSKTKKQLTRDQIYRILNKRAQEVGIKKTISPHVLRHSIASHILENGANLRIIQEFLGHSDIKTTQIYTHINTKQLLESYDKFHPKNK